MLSNEQYFLKELEKTLEKSYGKEILVDPKDNWDAEKEEKFKESRRAIDKKIRKNFKSLPLVKCSECHKELLHSKDRAYIYEYGICLTCYNHKEDFKGLKNEPQN